jgi:hypothetical protein
VEDTLTSQSKNSKLRPNLENESKFLDNEKLSKTPIFQKVLLNVGKFCDFWAKVLRTREKPLLPAPSQTICISDPAPRDVNRGLKNSPLLFSGVGVTLFSSLCVPLTPVA